MPLSKPLQSRYIKYEQSEGVADWIVPFLRLNQIGRLRLRRPTMRPEGPRGQKSEFPLTSRRPPSVRRPTLCSAPRASERARIEHTHPFWPLSVHAHYTRRFLSPPSGFSASQTECVARDDWRQETRRISSSFIRRTRKGRRALNVLRHNGWIGVGRTPRKTTGRRNSYVDLSSRGSLP